VIVDPVAAQYFREVADAAVREATAWNSQCEVRRSSRQGPVDPDRAQSIRNLLADQPFEIAEISVYVFGATPPQGAPSRAIFVLALDGDTFWMVGTGGRSGGPVDADRTRLLVGLLRRGVIDNNCQLEYPPSRIEVGQLARITLRNPGSWCAEYRRAFTTVERVSMGVRLVNDELGVSIDVRARDGGVIGCESIYVNMPE
jgi:hypothetical protein